MLRQIGNSSGIRAWSAFPTVRVGEDRAVERHRANRMSYRGPRSPGGLEAGASAGLMFTDGEETNSEPRNWGCVCGRNPDAMARGVLGGPTCGQRRGSVGCELVGPAARARLLVAALSHRRSARTERSRCRVCLRRRDGRSVADVSGNGNAGTIGASWTTSGKFGSACRSTGRVRGSRCRRGGARPDNRR